MSGYQVAVTIDLLRCPRICLNNLPALMLDASLQGLAYYAGTDPLRLPADYRLAFRELGLAIGLSAVEKLKELMSDATECGGRLGLNGRADDLLRYVPLGEDIRNFWLDPANREAGSWTEHREINMVMLANVAGLTGTGTTLGFEGYGRVQHPPSPNAPSLDFRADFSLVAIGVLSPGSPDFPPSPCIGMASDFPVRISLTFDEDGNLTGATARPLAR